MTVLHKEVCASDSDAGIWAGYASSATPETTMIKKGKGEVEHGLGWSECAVCRHLRYEHGRT